MKTKYKILIACTLVLSMLTAFAVTSFAAEDHNDIEYNNNTYTYNASVTGGEYLQIWDFDSISFYKTNGTVTNYEYDYIIISIDYDPDISYMASVFSNTFITTYNLYDNDDLYIVISGDYKYAKINSNSFVANATSINNSESLEYDVWYNSSLSTTHQINLLNNNVPNPLDKVNDFLGYLSTSLTQLTTMIITNQILILFIVAVPVISFVIGSFKRIKDAGRV